MLASKDALLLRSLEQVRSPTINYTHPILRYHTVEFEGFVASSFEGCVTKFVSQKALKSIV